MDEQMMQELNANALNAIYRTCFKHISPINSEITNTQQTLVANCFQRLAESYKIVGNVVIAEHLQRMENESQGQLRDREGNDYDGDDEDD